MRPHIALKLTAGAALRITLNPWFARSTLERIDTRQDSGEVRRIALGIADGIPLTVVYTDRAEAGEIVRRIISARVSSRHERQAYRKVFPL